MRDAQDPAHSVRITDASGADVLPVFSRDGRTMMWTAQRGEGERSSQVWVAAFDLEAAKAKASAARGAGAPAAPPPAAPKAP
jgi:hypothetical protein